MHEKVRFKEKLGFSLGVFGQNIIYGFFTTYIMIFYTDVLGITAAAAGTLFMIVRLWDAANDPIMGCLADRTRSRWGKFRPYMLWVPIPMGIITTLTFFAPEVSYGTKLVYAYATYLAWDIAYTAGDIPMWALTSVITQDTKERTGVITMARIFSIFGMVLPAVATVPLLKLFGGADGAGYTKVAGLYGLVCAVLMMGIFFTVRERVAHTEKRERISESIAVIIHNKPLLIIVASSIITNSVVAFRQSILVYYATYNLGNVDLVTLLMAATMGTMFLGMLLVPVANSVMGKRNSYIFFGLGLAISSICFYFSGYGSVKAVILWTLVSGIFSGAPSVLESAMIADTIEYAEWKTGVRAEGIIFSTQTFMAKFAGALSGGLAGLIFTIIGYVPNAAQTPKALNGLHAMMTVIPAAAVLAGLVPILFYTLTEKRHGEIVMELEARKQSAI
ncbi:MAG: MFS transporter [Pseudomonadota bacterium]